MACARTGECKNACPLRARSCAAISYPETRFGLWSHDFQPLEEEELKDASGADFLGASGRFCPPSLLSECASRFTRLPIPLPATGCEVRRGREGVIEGWVE